jgi:hypothetical protein
MTNPATDLAKFPNRIVAIAGRRDVMDRSKREPKELV